MSAHAELELAPAYALGALDEVERRTFEAHLQKCGECQAAVAAAYPVASAIGYGARPEPLPKGSGDRLLALFRAEKASGTWKPTSQDRSNKGPAAPGSATGRSGGGFLAAAAFALISAGMGAVAWQSKKSFDTEHKRAEDLESVLGQSRERVHSLEDSSKKAELARRTAEDKAATLQAQLNDCQQHGQDLAAVRDKLASSLASLGFSADAKEFKFKLTDKHANENYKVSYLYDKTTSQVALLGTFPQLPKGQVYKLWLITKEDGANALPLGAFDPSRQIDGYLVAEKLPPNKTFVGVAISIEKDARVEHGTDVVLLPG